MGNLFSGGQEAGFSDLQRALQQGVGQEQQYFGKGEQMLQPYQAGGTQAFQQALKTLTGQQTPAQTIAGIQAGFQQTPAQKFEQQQALEAARNQLSAQGISGSGAAAQELAQRVSDITGSQEQQYLQNVLGLRQQTLSDLLSGAQIGAGAAGQGAALAGQTGRSLADLYGQIGQAQLGEQQAQAAGTTGMLSGIGSTVGAIAPFISIL